MIVVQYWTRFKVAYLWGLAKYLYLYPPMVLREKRKCFPDAPRTTHQNRHFKLNDKRMIIQNTLLQDIWHFRY